MNPYVYRLYDLPTPSKIIDGYRISHTAHNFLPAAGLPEMYLEQCQTSNNGDVCVDS